MCFVRLQFAGEEIKAGELGISGLRGSHVGRAAPDAGSGPVSQEAAGEALGVAEAVRERALAMRQRDQRRDLGERLAAEAGGRALGSGQGRPERKLSVVREAVPPSWCSSQVTVVADDAVIPPREQTIACEGRAAVSFCS